MAAFPEIAHPPHLVAIEVPNDRSLRLVIAEQTGLGLPMIVLPGVVAQERVGTHEDSEFEVFWEVVVCFVTRGDPFPDDGAPSTTTISEVPEPSDFLRWVRTHCHATPEYVAAMSGRSASNDRLLRHWRVSTNEALFDVAAIDPPTIRRLSLD